MLKAEINTSNEYREQLQEYISTDPDAAGREVRPAFGGHPNHPMVERLVNELKIQQITNSDLVDEASEYAGEEDAEYEAGEEPLDQIQPGYRSRTDGNPEVLGCYPLDTGKYGNFQDSIRPTKEIGAAGGAAEEPLDPEGRPEGEGGEEIEVEEFARPVRVKAPTDPTHDEIEEHESTGHIQYRSWCCHSVAGRGVGQQHRTREEEARAQDGLPTITCDYTFMSGGGAEQEDERVKPILVIKDSKTSAVAATFVDHKGPTPYAVKYFANLLKMLGYRRVLAQSDGEPSIVALKTQAAQAAGVEAVPRESPPNEHQANGMVEQVCKEIKMHIRVGRSASEEKLNQALGDTDPLLAWLPRHVGDLLNRYRKGSDGKTPEQRRSGKQWRKPAIAFGERLYYRPVGAVERTPLKVGRYIGHHGRTGTLLLMTDSGVVRGQGIRRLSPADQWTTEDPWEVASRRPAGAREILIGEERLAVPAPERVAVVPPAGRRVYIRKEDVNKYGSTAGCPGCTCVLLDEPTVVPHTAMKPAHDKRRRSRQELIDKKQKRPVQDAARPVAEGDVAARDAVGAPGDALGDGSSQPARPELEIPEDPAEQIEMKRAVAEPATSAREEKKSKAVQPSKRPGALTIGSGPPLAKPKLSPTQGEKRTADTTVDGLREAHQPLSQPQSGILPEGAQMETGALTKQKKVFKTLIKRQVLNTYELRGLTINEEDADNIAELSCQMCAVDVMEIYSPKRFTDVATKYRLRPGFAVDPTEQKPDGSYWDLTKSEDVEEVERIVDQDKPELLTGSPPCHMFSQLQNISWHKISPEIREKRMAEAIHHLHVSCKMYRKQYDAGRTFLHEAPWGASSWKDPEVQAILALPGVSAQTRLEVNGTDTSILLVTSHEQQRSTRQLVKAVLKWLKSKLVRSGELGSTEANTSGPVPEEQFVNKEEFEDWFWDDVNGGWLPPDKVREARNLEMEYLKKQAVYEKRPISEAYKVTGRRPIPVRWLDTDKGNPTKPNFRSRVVVKDIKAAKAESEQLPQNLLFSSTPPLESMRLLCSLMSTQKLRHVDLLIRELGLETAKGVDTPDVKKSEVPLLPCQVPEEDGEPSQRERAAEAYDVQVVADEKERATKAFSGAEDSLPCAAASSAVEQPLPSVEVFGKDSSIAEADEDAIRGIASLAVAQSFQNAKVAASGYHSANSVAEDDAARAAASMAVSQCLQSAEAAANDHHNTVLEAQCVAAQHVESWTASILLLQQVLAGLNNGDNERLGGSTGQPLLEEAEEVASCRDESVQGPLDILEFDLQGIPEPPVTHEICESKDEEERPSTADLKQDDLVSTCDGSRRDPESRCDFWEGSELGRPGSSDRPHSERRERHEPISRPVKPLREEEECRENEDGTADATAGTMPPVPPMPPAPASPCQVEEDEQSDARRMRREAEKLVSEVEAKAQEVLKEQEEDEANAIRIRKEAERLVDELEAKAKKALREKHEEQLSATRIRQEAERIVDKVQEKAQEAAKEQQEQSNATTLRKKAAKLVDEVEAEARTALREQQERSQSRQEGRVEVKEAPTATATAEPDPATTKLRIEAEKLEAEIRATFTEQQKKDAADRAEATSRALDAQFEALRRSEEDRAEAFQALEATREVVRQGDLAYAKAELSETARREAEERAKAQEKEIQDARRRMMQEQALQKTESERREALKALEATRQVARNSNDDAKANHAIHMNVPWGQRSERSRGGNAPEHQNAVARRAGKVPWGQRS
eukprot:s1304_g16.t1